jgi:MoaA/NifB/PqqE/SkfB family radical SAM enzyme
METHMDAVLTNPAKPGSVQDLSFLWLEITAKCNLECVHCYADSDPRQDLFGYMQTEHWLSILRESADLGCKQVQFIGGEPTLHPGLARMISFAFESGYRFIEVFTNASVLNESLLQTFAEYRVHVAISFYSDDPETHDLITKHKGSFNRTVTGIKRLVTAGLQIRAGIIEMQENAGHSARAKGFLEQLGVSEVKIDFQRGVGRGGQLIQSLNPMDELCGECWKGKLCVTSSGRVYPCVFSRFADLGTAQSGIQNIVNDNALLEFRTALRNNHRKKQLRESSSTQVRSCDPETDCGPDVKCEPTSSRCGPMVFEPCGPDCSPHSPACAPIDCAPGERGPLELSYTEWQIGLAGCDPTCAPCGPVSFCVPERICGPDRKCNPTSGPCEPERACVPKIRSYQTEFSV